MLSFLEMLQVAIDNGASDVFIVAGQPLSYKKGRKIYEMYIELLRTVLNMFAKRNLRSKATSNISYMMDKTISKYNEKYN